MSDMDPRWEWIEVTRFSDPGPVYIKGACNHLETVAVDTRDWLARELDEPGETVAYLCETCNMQVSGP